MTTGPRRFRSLVALLAVVGGLALPSTPASAHQAAGVCVFTGTLTTGPATVLATDIVPFGFTSDADVCGGIGGFPVGLGAGNVRGEGTVASNCVSWIGTGRFLVGSGEIHESLIVMVGARAVVLGYEAFGTHTAMTLEMVIEVRPIPVGIAVPCVTQGTTEWVYAGVAAIASV